MEREGRAAEWIAVQITRRRSALSSEVQPGLSQAKQELRDRVQREREEEDKRALRFRPELNASHAESVLKVASSPEKYTRYVQERRARLEKQARQLLSEREVLPSKAFLVKCRNCSLKPHTHSPHWSCHKSAFLTKATPYCTSLKP